MPAQQPPHAAQTDAVLLGQFSDDRTSLVLLDEELHDHLTEPCLDTRCLSGPRIRLDAHALLTVVFLRLSELEYGPMEVRQHVIPVRIGSDQVHSRSEALSDFSGRASFAQIQQPRSTILRLWITFGPRPESCHAQVMVSSPKGPRLRIVTGGRTDDVSLDEAAFWLDPPEDELAPHWVPTYASRLPMDVNVRWLSRELWGKARSEWTELLAQDVVERVPQAAFGRAARGWAAGVLCVAAVDAGMKSDRALWEHILNDVTTMTEVSRATALRRWRELRQLGMLGPKNPPVYWHDGPQPEG